MNRKELHEVGKVKNKWQILYLLIVSVILFQNILRADEYKTFIKECFVPVELTHSNSGLKTIDCIYIINLAERPEKWSNMKKLCNERNLNVNRVDAVNGWKLSQCVKQELTGDVPIGITGGQYGCLLSHLSALKNARKNRFDVVWIMEDDVKFVDDVQIIPKLLARLSNIDKEWDIFFTDVPQRGESKEFPLNEDFKRLIKRNDMHSLIISKRGVKKILKHYYKTYIRSAIDYEIHRIPEIREYSPIKNIVTREFNTPSDTSNCNF
jgi:Glycosyltransferase family 25 (LPS biosynthesis protein)